MSLEREVNEIQKLRLDEYLLNPDRISGDSRAAQRAAMDHIGCWFFELFQNGDDAEAKCVHVRVTEKAVYFCDTGKGLKTSALKAISSTDLSDKGKDTIGRKGVGFKAVYAISLNPKKT